MPDQNIKPILKARQWLAELNKLCCFMSVEKVGKNGKLERATNSELQRWLDQGSVLVNGERIGRDELMDFPIISVVLFPKSEQRRCTLL